MNTPKEYKDKFEEKNITWMKSSSFLKPNDFDYKDNEKKQLDFIIDIVSELMPNSEITTTVELSEDNIELKITALAKDEDVNGWDEHIISWKMPTKSEDFKRYVDDYGYYWGVVRYTLNYLPVSFTTLMRYFQPEFAKEDGKKILSYYIGGEEYKYYVDREEMSEYHYKVKVYNKPLDKVEDLNNYIYSIIITKLDTNDMYPINL